MPETILFRRGIDLQHEEEFQTASNHLNVVEQRTKVPDHSTVIGRYSVLPYYRELEEDLATFGSKLINTWEQHNWIANFDYYEPLKEFTPESWTDNNFHLAPVGQFIVKGRTNSRKQNWADLMYAPNKRFASLIASSLASDPLIGPQGIIYRRYISLVTYDNGINGVPHSNEWRFFYYKTTRLSYGYYWSVAEDADKLEISPEGVLFADKLAKIVSEYTNFFVLDIAETQAGGWILIEINDGQMSGLSCNSAETLYTNLKLALSH